jgi:hypothetical protein
MLIYWSRARAPTETMEGTTATIFGYDSVQHAYVLDIPDGANSNTITFGSAKHEIDTLLIPNIFAAASFLIILVQWAYKKWTQSKGKESVTDEAEDELEADGYRWKEGEDRILAWNVGRCTGCVILLGTSVWQVVSGKSLSFLATIGLEPNLNHFVRPTQDIAEYWPMCCFRTYFIALSHVNSFIVISALRILALLHNLPSSPRPTFFIASNSGPPGRIRSICLPRPDTFSDV